MVWLIGLGVGGLVYLFFTGSALSGLMRLQKRRILSSPPTRVGAPAVGAPAVSIIIAAHNEEAGIAETLRSLLNQSYPRDHWEIIVVDDRSTDCTADIITWFQTDCPQLRLIRQTTVNLNRSPKRQALEKAIAEANHEIIAVTDADCKPGPYWLKNLIEPFTRGADMVIGQARFEVNERHPWWQRLQALDFQAQMVMASGLAASGMPFNCSGASLAYRRHAFHQVRGWEGYNHLISGDDELLMAKFIQNNLPICSAAGPEAIVLTTPPPTIRELWRQRTRWGSKGLNYRPSRALILAGVFLFYVALLCAPLFVFSKGAVSLAMTALCIKIIMDALILFWGRLLFKDEIPLLTFLAAELLHPPLIVAFVIVGHLSPVRWKNQKFNAHPREQTC